MQKKVIKLALKKGHCALLFGIELLLLLLVVACSPNGDGGAPRNRWVQPSFYYWRSVYQTSAADSLYLDSLSVERLYLRFFDLDWDDTHRQVVPIAPVVIDEPLLSHLELVPTIFIANRSFAQLPADGIDSLAARVARRVAAMCRQYNIGNPIVEIQFDCDWTSSTRDRYFAFLRAFAQLPAYRHIPLSATIRLHQIKYAAQTGVPPVERGMLMCYNMGELRATNTNNSILDTDILSNYIGKLSTYSLPLDIGLPLFSWGVVFRQGRFEGLLNGWRMADVAGVAQLKAIDDHTFRVSEPWIVGNISLQTNDVIRIEQCDMAALRRAARLLAPRWQTDTARVIFYHLDPDIRSYYPAIHLRELTNVLK